MDEQHYLLIIGYLEGNLTEEETQYLLEKVKTDKEFSEAFEDIAEIFSAKTHLHGNDNRAHRALAKLNVKIDELEHTELVGNEVPQKRFFKIQQWMAVAASVVLLAAGFFIYQTAQNSLASHKNHPAYAAIYTLPGQQKKVTLPDGTSVILNASSSLRLADDFGQEKRKVYLNGEAWFDVKRNPQKPFIVTTGKVATQVLGTHFNVSAYQNDSNITVSLVQGKVQVDISNDLAKRMILDPGKQLVYSKADQQTRVADFTTEEITGWKENKLVFNYDSWPEVAKKLSRWYGIPVELKDSTLLHCKLKGTFDRLPFEKVMQQLNYVSAVSWKKENNKIIISGKCD